jgi:hypothetical protein
MEQLNYTSKEQTSSLLVKNISNGWLESYIKSNRKMGGTTLIILPCVTKF